MQTPVLVTIPTSHYCEKARWALDRAGIAYVERGHLPFFSRLATWRSGRWSSVPLLRDGDEIIADSTSIMRWASERGPAERRLYPEAPEARHTVDELVKRIDLGIGRAARILMLAHVLPNRRAALKLARTGVPKLEWLGMGAIYPVAHLGMRRLYGITDQTVRDARRELDEELTDLSRLFNDGRRYLTGDRFTAADLTLAALAAPIVLPAGVPRIPAFDDLPPEGRADVERYRATRAGAHVLRLYHEERAS